MSERSDTATKSIIRQRDALIERQGALDGNVQALETEIQNLNRIIEGGKRAQDQRREEAALIEELIKKKERQARIEKRRADAQKREAKNARDMAILERELAKSRAKNEEVRKQMMKENIWAVENQMQRLMEAYQRGMWDASDEEIEKLKQIYLELEAEMEEQEE